MDDASDSTEEIDQIEEVDIQLKPSHHDLSDKIESSEDSRIEDYDPIESISNSLVSSQLDDYIENVNQILDGKVEVVENGEDLQIQELIRCKIIRDDTESSPFWSNGYFVVLLCSFECNILDCGIKKGEKVRVIVRKDLIKNNIILNSILSIVGNYLAFNFKNEMGIIASSIRMQYYKN